MSVWKNLTVPSFSRAIRGYSTQEVDKYIDSVIEKYTVAVRENSSLRKRLAEALASTEKASDTESSKAPMSAEAEKNQTDAESIISQAKAEADKIISDARYKADALISNAKAEADKFLTEQRRTASELNEAASALYGSITEEYGRHISRIEAIIEGAKELVNKNTDIEDFKHIEENSEGADNTDEYSTEQDKCAESELKNEAGAAEPSSGTATSADNTDGNETEPYSFAEGETVCDNANITSPQNDDFYSPGESEPFIDDELKRLMSLYAIDLAGNAGDSPAEKAEKTNASDPVNEASAQDQAVPQITESTGNKTSISSEDFYDDGENEFPNGQDVDFLSLTAMNVMKKNSPHGNFAQKNEK